MFYVNRFSSLFSKAFFNRNESFMFEKFGVSNLLKKTKGLPRFNYELTKEESEILELDFKKMFKKEINHIEHFSKIVEGFSDIIISSYSLDFIKSLNHNILNQELTKKEYVFRNLLKTYKLFPSDSSYIVMNRWEKELLEDSKNKVKYLQTINK
jgi:hypothetical protein